MKLRVATVSGFGLLFGAWAYLDELSLNASGAVYDFSSGSAALLAFMLLAILTGFLVGRWWALLALLGPVASLGYLQATGHRGPDGVPPLTGLPSIAFFLWFALLLMLGIGIGCLWHHLRARGGPSGLRSP